MSAQDRDRWDAVYGERATPAPPRLPAVFAAYRSHFPSSGAALEIACGTGAASVWLAQRGLRVHGVDVSATAIDAARRLAGKAGVTARFDTFDLDGGLPPGDLVQVLLCHKFRAPTLYNPMMARLVPGGLLAICVLSEVGAEPGRFRAAAGELRSAFAGLDVIASGEGDGQAWLLARRPC